MLAGSDLSSRLRGLAAAEAAARLAAEGYNELPQADRRTPFRIIFEVLREPMLALLIGGGVIYLALGDVKEAFVLLVFACLSVVITVVQETRTERVLEALRDLTSPRALVIRDGERQRIAGREVVRGDLIVLAEGDRVPADVRLVEGQDLQADESLLHGSPLPDQGVVFDGGDGNDTLAVTGTNSASGELNVAANQVQLGSLPAIGLVSVESTTLSLAPNAQQSTAVAGGTLIVSDSSALADGSSLIVSHGGIFVFDPTTLAAPAAHTPAAANGPALRKGRCRTARLR